MEGSTYLSYIQTGKEEANLSTYDTSITRFGFTQQTREVVLEKEGGSSPDTRNRDSNELR